MVSDCLHYRGDAPLHLDNGLSELIAHQNFQQDLRHLVQPFCYILKILDLALGNHLGYCRAEVFRVLLLVNTHVHALELDQSVQNIFDVLDTVTPSGLLTL